MNHIDTICICGGGSLGTVIAGVLSSKGYKINLLTGHPESWNPDIDVTDCEGTHFNGHLSIISSDAAIAVPGCQVVLLCVPGYLIKPELSKIAPYVAPGTFLGSVFSSTGFFFEALDMFGDDIHLWGFQRVPFISRVKEYGKSANLLGYKSEYNIAVERASDSDKEEFRQWIETVFDRPTRLLGNYLEASLTNSNPLLHTSRLYSIYKDWRPGMTYPENPYFYAEWDDDASELLIAMDRELFALIDVLPVSKTFLPTILDYYESHDASSLSAKLRSIESFKAIKAPMVQTAEGWIPDFDSRYFTEDFAVGLKYVRDLAKKYGVAVPTMDKIYTWGVNLIEK